MKKTVIVHPTDGLFVGISMGMAFFSFMDNAGQVECSSFESEETAREFIKKLQEKVAELTDKSGSKPSDWWNPDGFRYVSVDSATGKGATYAELCRAGLEREAATLNPAFQGLEGGHA